MKQNHTFVSSLAQIFLCNIFTTIFSKEHLFKIAEFYKKFSFSKTLHISRTVSVDVYSTTGSSFRNIENTVWNNLFLTGLLVTLIQSPVTRYICYMGLVLNFFQHVKTHQRLKLFFVSDFREKFTNCSSRLLEFKSVGIFAISFFVTKIPHFFDFRFF